MLWVHRSQPGDLGPGLAIAPPPFPLLVRVRHSMRLWDASCVRGGYWTLGMRGLGARGVIRGPTELRNAGVLERWWLNTVVRVHSVGVHHAALVAVFAEIRCLKQGVWLSEGTERL